MTPARPGGDLRMTPPPGPAEVFQGDGAPLKAEASGENHGPRAAGRRPASNVSDRPAETRRGSGTPLEMKAGVTEPTNYTKLSKKIIRQSRRFSKLKPV